LEEVDSVEGLVEVDSVVDSVEVDLVVVMQGHSRMSQSYSPMRLSGEIALPQSYR